jgi:hypothetical protein
LNNSLAVDVSFSVPNTSPVSQEIWILLFMRVRFYAWFLAAYTLYTRSPMKQ